MHSLLSRRAVARASLAGAAVLAGSVSHAFPTRPVRFVVPLPPGGSTDLIARGLADSLSARLKQPVIVENIPGAGTSLATQNVIASPPDGHTIYITSFSVAIQSAVANARFDARRDLVPVALLGEGVLVLAGSAGAPPRTIAELISYSKQRPGELNYGTSGVASVTHLILELFVQRAGIQVAHVHYRGGHDMLLALMRNEAHFGLEQMGTIRPHVEAGKIRALGVVTARRWPGLDELPGMAESGVPGVDISVWQGIFAPRNTPKEFVDKLAADIEAVKQEPKIQDLLSRFAIRPSQGDLGKLVAEGVDIWADVIRKGGIKLE